ncbi:small ribosomal subunit protein uS9m isoform X2 [Alligator mississippiensis]|uniref:small ribosomal subunit protein uS9m isoform X2 n=1 Tax=Alligator mississippiensis TaxID=8496 RepID=UPI0028772EC9|nr:small ribosomal subunit protein uS9m isoform X2 [Alligator mississippiensis]
MAAAVRRVLWLSGAWSAARATPGAQTLRLICTSTAVQKKIIHVSGPEKYTGDFIKEQIEEFNLGKRHLANMMGEDPETFTQEDIDKAIAYLFPSGLFEKKARPIMKDPKEIFASKSVSQWGEDGRPFHFLFYTGSQSYYSLLHEIYGKLLRIQKYEDEMRAQGSFPETGNKLKLIGSRWLIKKELEEMLLEKLSDQDYSLCIRLLERLVALPCSGNEEEYVLKFRRGQALQLQGFMNKPLQYDEQGVAFSTGEGKRKTARATAIVYDSGSGKITVNGVHYAHYFPVLQDREQLMFPAQFLDRLGKHDIICTVSGGGRSSQAGAIRLAIARALSSFATKHEVECMRQAGLLVSDPRLRERKKPGQEGARRKFTWRKR